MPENTVYVGRGSKWGNPYRVVPLHRSGPFDIMIGEHFCGQSTGRYLAHKMVKNRFIQAQKMGWHNTLPNDYTRAELAGKNLACWCPLDMPCHADVLLQLANEETK